MRKDSVPPNEYEVGEEVSVILFSTGERVLCDTYDLPLLKYFTWKIIVRSTRRGRVLNYPGAYLRDSSKPRYILMHRLIVGAPKGMEVDHINGDTLDNRRSNLRLATASQNRNNMPLTAKNTSGYKGVRYEPQRQNWTVQFKYDGIIRYIGTYSSIEDAALAYNRAAKKIVGEFAHLNDIEDDGRYLHASNYDLQALINEDRKPPSLWEEDTAA